LAIIGTGIFVIIGVAAGVAGPAVRALNPIEKIPFSIPTHPVLFHPGVVKRIIFLHAGFCQ